MQNASVRLWRMLTQSASALVRPQPHVFRAYSSRSEASDALIYVAAAVVFTALVGLIIAGPGNFIGLLYAIVNQLFSFYIFAGVAFFVGQRQGGLGSLEEVAYSFALFYVPIYLLTWALRLVALWLPAAAILLPWLWLLGVLALAAQLFYGQVAIRGVMGLRSPKDALIAVGIAVLALWLLQLIFGRSGFLQI